MKHRPAIVALPSVKTQAIFLAKGGQVVGSVGVGADDVECAWIDTKPF